MVSNLLNKSSKRLSKVLVFLTATTVSACSTMNFTDLFMDYGNQMQPYRTALLMGDFSKAETELGSRSSSNTNYVLFLLEQGRTAHLKGDWLASKKWFDKAYQIVEEEHAKAKIQIGSGIEKTSALLSNDSAIRYQLAAYEQSMMHSYQALNYLHLNDFSGALVEIRRANIVQTAALEKYEDELIEAQQELRNTGLKNNNEINNAYRTMDVLIGNLKNGIQNAYTFYLSALLYEASGELNDAYIDYKKALEIFPDNIFVQQDVLRLAKKLAMTDDLTLFTEKFGDKLQQIKDNSQLTSPESKTGQIVVIYENKLIDPKQAMSLNLPISTSGGDLRFYSISVPIYEGKLPAKNGLVLEVNDKSVQASNIISLQSLVAKQLKDELPSILTRQILRVVAKEQVRRKMSSQGGDIGNILAAVYNVASENADTRSWLSLPGSIQVLKHELPIGDHQIPIRGVSRLSTINVKINPNKMTIVLVNEMSGFSQYKTINL